MNFYSIIDSETTDDEFIFNIEFNSEHQVFAGHFPGQPVVPGVLLMRLVRDLVRIAIDREVRLSEAKSVKFLKAVDPTITAKLDIAITVKSSDTQFISISAQGNADQNTYFKLRATYRQSS